MAQQQSFVVDAMLSILSDLPLPEQVAHPSLNTGHRGLLAPGSTLLAGDAGGERGAPAD